MQTRPNQTAIKQFRWRLMVIATVEHYMLAPLWERIDSFIWFGDLPSNV